MNTTMSREDWKIEIVSGEADGPGTIELYEGTRSPRAIRARLTRERCGGDRWAYVRIDGVRVEDDRIHEVSSIDGEVRCQCGEADGSEPCAWTGPRSETVVVEYMPRQHRDSHAAAGNTGSYPHNGAVRLRVERSCADLIIADNLDWCAEVST